VTAVATDRLRFDLPPAQEAGAPAEARGVRRDGVRLLVASRSSGELTHTTFDRIVDFLSPGDLVVVNTSGVIPAAIHATAPDGSAVVVHLSTRLDDGRWVVELRRPDGTATVRWTEDIVPLDLSLGDGASVHLHERYRGGRLWTATVRTTMPLFAWLERHGRPIHYGYVEHPWPLSAYQNVYADEPGSAEMPSAGRPFSAEVITRLIATGVDIAPLVLHTGVASLESTELPYPERLRVPATTAERVNLTRRLGGRIVAVGTTVVRGLETAGESGIVEPYDGWTDLVITPERGVRIVDGLLTGWHEPEASHLLMLEAVAGRDLLERSYAASLANGYLWHEFGDEHLILP